MRVIMGGSGSGLWVEYDSADPEEPLRRRFSKKVPRDPCAFFFREFARLTRCSLTRMCVISMPALLVLSVVGFRRGCDERMMAPVPLCRSYSWCVHDYVRLNDRVMSPPPLWSEEDYVKTFPNAALRNGSTPAPGMRDMQFIVSLGLDATSASRAQSIEDTWGEVRFSSHLSFFCPLLQCAAPPLASFFTRSRKNIQEPGLRILYMGGVGSWNLPHEHEKDHHLMLVDGTGSSPDDEQGMEWLKMQHRMLWGLKEAYNKGDVSLPWFVSTGDDSVVFPASLLEFLSKYNPDMPVAFGHLVSNPDVQGLAPYHTGKGLTWPDVDAGVVFSRGALLQIGPALYSDRCPFFLSASMTIGLCCWKRGVFMAYVEGVLVTFLDCCFLFLTANAAFWEWTLFLQGGGGMCRMRASDMTFLFLSSEQAFDLSCRPRGPHRFLR